MLSFVRSLMMVRPSAALAAGIKRMMKRDRSAPSSLRLSQIRLTVHAARRSVRVKVADQAHYSGRDAAAVVLQSARESAKAFDEAMYRKSALLQQRRSTGG